MTINAWLTSATKRLREAGIDSARLDALILLEDVLGRDRAWLLAHPQQKIGRLPLLRLNTKIMQRARRTPLAYLRRRAEFYGRTFAVNRHVLCPRPESEAIITLLKALPGQPQTVLDVGTGSGCLAITAALELPDARVTATDIDCPALDVAAANARRLGAKVRFVQANLLGRQSAEVVLANLPYVPNNAEVSPEVRREPRIAVFAGADGLDLYRRFWRQLAGRQQRPQHVLAESRPADHATMRKLAKAAGYKLQKTTGFVQQYGIIKL